MASTANASQNTIQVVFTLKPQDASRFIPIYMQNISGLQILNEDKTKQLCFFLSLPWYTQYV